ncbi:MAG: hypothetical protein IKK16_06475, partial [Bacteroidaceae bacterium]|nr:hypothetical protein [Bacteroidaceae bacterium]
VLSKCTATEHIPSAIQKNKSKHFLCVVVISIIFYTFAVEIIVEGFGCLQPHKKIAKTVLCLRRFLTALFV